MFDSECVLRGTRGSAGNLGVVYTLFRTSATSSVSEEAANEALDLVEAIAASLADVGVALEAEVVNVELISQELTTPEPPHVLSLRPPQSSVLSPSSSAALSSTTRPALTAPRSPSGSSSRASCPLGCRLPRPRQVMGPGPVHVGIAVGRAFDNISSICTAIQQLGVVPKAWSAAASCHFQMSSTTLFRAGHALQRSTDQLQR